MAHIIITGGSSGIGAALADAYAARGADVSLIARTAEALAAAKERLQTLHGAGGGRIHCETADVADRNGIETAIAACEAALGPCDILICSAGIVHPGAFEALPADAFEAQIRTNLFGTVNAVRAVYPGMIARQSGRILMLGSGAGLIGIYGYTAYCASKYAVLGFAEALRTEARGHGVGVSICFPPDTDTPQLAAERTARPAEAEATIRSGGQWTAGAVARLAIAGLERGRFAIHAGTQLKLLGLFGSLAMPLLRPWFDRKIAGERHRRTRGPKVDQNE